MLTERRQRECAAQHFGAWQARPGWLSAMVAEYRAGRLPVPEQSNAREAIDPAEDFAQEYRIQDGIAVIDCYGHLTKYRSSFGGASYIGMKHALRRARTTSPARAAMIALDTPGGTVAGAGELIQEIQLARAEGFPVFAFCDDGCHSAGYRIAAACTRIYANPTGQVGCIGTYTVLTDSTAEAESMGLKEYLVSSGGAKGLGADGKVTQELIDDVAREIGEMNALFLAEVKAGRNFTDEQVEAIADGRSHIASKALVLGLVDEILPIDDAFDQILKRSKSMNREDFLNYARENHDDLQAAHAAAFPTKPASVKEIKEACTGCDSDFVMSQAEAGATIDQAKDAWLNTLAARLEIRDEQVDQLKSEHTEAIKAKDEEIGQLKTDIENVKVGATDEQAAGASDAENKNEAGASAFQRAVRMNNN